MNWEKFLKRVIGIVIISVLLGLAFEVQAAEAKETGATQNWTSFVVHIREGRVDELTQGNRCIGDGTTAGCARWKAANPVTWLDGECWITVPKWEGDDRGWTRAQIAAIWGYEFAHCAKGNYHE